MMVSIICITYNHEKFIRTALNSFLMQKTIFEYEILVHDDASTDNTAKILKEYEAKYPNLFKVIYQKVNQFQNGKSPISILLEKAKGKYLAFCEGDDYWVDSKKLQKQIDFLENNPEYSAVYHNVFIVNENNEFFDDICARKCFPLYSTYTLERYKAIPGILNGQLGTLVCVNFWNNFTDSDKFEYIKCKSNGDVKINLILNNIGSIKFMENIMGCYRRTYIGDSYNSRTKYKDVSQKRYNDIYSLIIMVENIFNINIDQSLRKKSLCMVLCAYLVKFFKSRKNIDFIIFKKLYIRSNEKIYFIYFFIYKLLIYFLKYLNILKNVPQRDCHVDKLK